MYFIKFKWPSNVSKENIIYCQSNSLNNINCGEIILSSEDRVQQIVPGALL